MDYSVIIIIIIIIIILHLSFAVGFVLRDLLLFCMQYESVLFIDQGSSSLTIGERICVAFIPLIAIFEVLIFAFSDCFGPRQPRLKKCAEEIPRLVNETICKDFEVPSIHYMNFFFFF